MDKKFKDYFCPFGVAMLCYEQNPHLGAYKYGDHMQINGGLWSFVTTT